MEYVLLLHYAIRRYSRGVRRRHCAVLIAHFSCETKTVRMQKISKVEDIPMLALPKKRPLLVEDEGGGGL